MKCEWIDSDTIKTILKLVGLFALPAIVNAIGIYLIWNWYFPVLFGLKNINYAGSMGMSLFWLIATNKFIGVPNLADKETIFLRYIDQFLLRPIVWLSIAYIMHFFIS